MYFFCRVNNLLLKYVFKNVNGSPPCNYKVEGDLLSLVFSPLVFECVRYCPTLNITEYVPLIVKIFPRMYMLKFPGYPTFHNSLNYFRALKTKHDTPKYGLIYHASLVGQSSSKTKGKVI